MLSVCWDDQMKLGANNANGQSVIFFGVIEWDKLVNSEVLVTQIAEITS